MDILYLLIPLSVLLAVAIGVAFWRAVDTGQFDDLEAPGLRILADDDDPGPPIAAIRDRHQGAAPGRAAESPHGHRPAR